MVIGIYLNCHGNEEEWWTQWEGDREGSGWGIVSAYTKQGIVQPTRNMISQHPSEPRGSTCRWSWRHLRPNRRSINCSLVIFVFYSRSHSSALPFPLFASSLHLLFLFPPFASSLLLLFLFPPFAFSLHLLFIFLPSLLFLFCSSFSSFRFFSSFALPFPPFASSFLLLFLLLFTFSSFSSFRFFSSSVSF